MMRIREAVLCCAVLAVVVFAACGDVPVDQDTANAVRRDRDTIVLKPDTVIITRDSIIIRHDTLFTNPRDTVTLLDTVLIETRPLLWSGSLRVPDPALETDIAVDTVASALKIYLDNGRAKRIDFVLLSRVPERPNPPPFRTPSWVHLAVVNYDLAISGDVPLNVDPTRTPGANGMGVLFRTTPSEPVRWFATTDASAGSFSVVSVDHVARRIRAVATARFFALGSSTPAVRIDTLHLTMQY